jgi:hypothetical protein
MDTANNAARPVRYFFREKQMEMDARAETRRVRAILAKMPTAQVFGRYLDKEAFRVVDAKSRGPFTMGKNEAGEWVFVSSFEVRGVN